LSVVAEDVRGAGVRERRKPKRRERDSPQRRASQLSCELHSLFVYCPAQSLVQQITGPKNPSLLLTAHPEQRVTVAPHLVGALFITDLSSKQRYDTETGEL